MAFQDIAPPVPPTPVPGGPQVVVRPGQEVLIDGKPVGNAEAVYRGFVHQRDELNHQMDRLKDERRDIVNRLSGEENLNAADRAGLEKRVTAIDARMDALDKQIAVADQQVASAAAIPGAIVDRPPEIRHGPPEEVFVLGGIFMFVAILPISIAFARRIWRRSAAAVAAIPADLMERFTQIDQAVESIAVEVERIGEGQRFVTRVLSEQGSRAALADGSARVGDARARSE